MTSKYICHPHSFCSALHYFLLFFSVPSSGTSIFLYLAKPGSFFTVSSVGLYVGLITSSVLPSVFLLPQDVSSSAVAMKHTNLFIVLSFCICYCYVYLCHLSVQVLWCVASLRVVCRQKSSSFDGVCHPVSVLHRPPRPYMG